MVLLASLLIPYFSIQLCFASKNEEIDFIIEYIQKQESFMTVSALLCWDKENSYLLANKLKDNNIPGYVKDTLENEAYFPHILNHIFVVDLSCTNTNNILLKANKNNAFIVPNHWLLLNTTTNSITPKKHELIKNLDVLMSSKFAIVQSPNEGKFNLEYLYKIDKTSNEIISYEIANYTKNTGLQYHTNKAIVIQRKNLNFYNLRIGLVIMINRSYDHLFDYRYKDEDTFSKTNLPLLYLMRDYLNATSNTSFTSRWYNMGTKNQSGSLLGKIINNEIDMPATPYFCLQDRLVYYECLPIAIKIDSSFIFRRPPLSYVKDIYGLPFAKELWFTYSSFYLLTAILLYVIVDWEWKILEETNTTPDVDMIPSRFSDMLLFNVGAVCQQGYATEPKGTPGKILILTIFVTLIFLFTAYSAYIVVLFQSTADDIKTLDDLYKSSIILGAEDQHYFKLMFTMFTDGIRHKIYKDKLTPKGQTPHFYHKMVGIERLRREYFAFFIDRITGYKLINELFYENEKCGLQAIQYADDRYNNAYLVVPKNNTYTEIFKIGYLWMLESGLVRREMKLRLAEKPTCSTEGNNFREAGILDLYSIYMILICGSCFSVVMLFFEIIVHRLVKRYGFTKHSIYS